MDRETKRYCSTALWALGVLVAAHGSIAAEARGGAAEELQEVLVTGSRVITNGNNSPTPVTVLSTEDLLQANPTNVSAALSAMPSMLGTASNQGGSGPNYVPVLNLRGMGGTRNLVMVDGHRLTTTSGNGGLVGGVNSALIPTMLLKRVDIVTGGASAVYGSDAVSGVINYIMDNAFNGVKVNVQGGQSNYSDDRGYNLGLAAGTRLFGGRGHVEVGYQRIVDNGIPDRFSRDSGQQVWSLQGDGSAGNPYTVVRNSRFNTFTFNGIVRSGPLNGLQFTSGGALATFNHGAATGTASVESGGDGAYYTTYPLIGSQRQDLGMGRFDFNLTDNVKVYLEILASTTRNHQPQNNFVINNRAVGYNNAFLATVQAPYSTTIAAQRAANATSSFNFSRIFTPDQIPAPLVEALGRQNAYLAGLEGNWGKYNWTVGYESNRSGTRTVNPSNISNPRLYAAMNAVTNASGQVVCNAAIANPSVYGNCVPLNAFGTVTPAALAYISAYTWGQTKFGIEEATASIAGAPMDNWVGPVNMAVSAAWRRNTYSVDSNAQTNDPVSCTGIQFNCPAATPPTPYFTTATNIQPEVSNNVKELAYEVELPLLKDRLLAKSAAFNGAARYTNYSTSGTVWTWKAGFTWAPSDDWNLRVARSRDIRAPSLANLFNAASCQVFNLNDIYVSGQSGPVTACNQGDPTLEPEKADTWTVGLVWTPQFLSGLSTSLDWYHIQIAGALNLLSSPSAAAVTACHNGDTAICARYIRPTPTSFPTYVINGYINSGGLWGQGVDWEVNYAHPMAGRRFSVRLLASYQPELKFDTGPTGIFYAAGAVDTNISGMPPLPNLKSVLQLNYEVVSGLTVSLQERYRNAMKLNSSVTPVFVYATGKIPPVTYTDLNFSFKPKSMDGNMNVLLNIRNVFNKQPPVVADSGSAASFGATGGALVGDDVVGRYYTLGLNYKFF